MQPPTTNPAQNLESAYDICRNITRREAKNFYYAFLTLPATKRRAIYAAYAFCRHCDDSVDKAISTNAKLKALTELQTNLDLTYSEIIIGVKSDLVKDRFQNFEELKGYCYSVASVVGLICLHIFGYEDDTAKEYAVDLGLAMQLTNIIRDVREDLDMGRVYLPQDELVQFGYTEKDLKNGVRNEAFIELMQFQSQRARKYFEQGFKLLPYLSRRSRACPAVLGALYSNVLDRIEASDYDVLESRVALSAPQKVVITAKTWLGCMLPFPSNTQ